MNSDIIFSWILSGLVTYPVSTSTIQVDENCKEYVNPQFRKCWEFKELFPLSVTIQEDQYCEDFYKATTTRSDNGRYVVRLPLNSQCSNTPRIGRNNKVKVPSDTEV